MLGFLSFIGGCVVGGLLASRLLSGRFTSEVADEMARAAGFESLEKLSLYGDEVQESLAKFKDYRAVLEAKVERLEAENAALWSEVAAKNIDGDWYLYPLSDSDMSDWGYDTEAEARAAFRLAKGLATTTEAKTTNIKEG